MTHFTGRSKNARSTARKDNNTCRPEFSPFSSLHNTFSKTKVTTRRLWKLSPFSRGHHPPSCPPSTAPPPPSPAPPPPLPTLLPSSTPSASHLQHPLPPALWRSHSLSKERPPNRRRWRRARLPDCGAVPETVLTPSRPFWGSHLGLSAARQHTFAQGLLGLIALCTEDGRLGQGGVRGER